MKQADSILSDDQVRRMREVPAFRDSPTGFIDPAGAIDYFTRKYVANLGRCCDLSKATLLDAGCHEGWNLLAFLLAGGRAAIGIDMNAAALRVASEFARILGVRDRLLLCEASIARLPLANRSVDLVCCVEVLEHLYGLGDAALAELNRVAREAILITTPNKCSPVIAHDTRLPFAHWLPPGHRGAYARLFGRGNEDEKNVFLTPRQVRRGLADFRLESEFMAFSSFQAFESFYPHYLPYMGHGTSGVRHLGGLKRLAYGTIHRLLGKRAFDVLPTLTGLFVRDADLPTASPPSP